MPDLQAQAPLSDLPQELTDLGHGKQPVKDMPCPYEDCEQFFRSQHNVDQHIREKHTLERPWKCWICAEQGNMRAGKPAGEFARPGALERHYRRVHDMVVKSKTGPPKPPTRKIVGVNAVALSEAAPVVKRRDPGGARSARPSSSRTGTEEPRERTMVCEVAGCGRMFDDAEDALVHYHAKHDYPQTQACPCKLCRKLFGGWQQQMAPQARREADFFPQPWPPRQFASSVQTSAMNQPVPPQQHVPSRSSILPQPIQSSYLFQPQLPLSPLPQSPRQMIPQQFFQSSFLLQPQPQQSSLPSSPRQLVPQQLFHTTPLDQPAPHRPLATQEIPFLTPFNLSDGPETGDIHAEGSLLEHFSPSTALPQNETGAPAPPPDTTDDEVYFQLDDDGDEENADASEHDAYVLFPELADRRR